ncbi:amino acid transporter, partial [Ramicandelaber brevisporus]
LPRSIGALGGASFVAGGMIGSGIFSTSSIVALLAGGPWPALLLWVIGAIISVAGAFTYTELGAMMTESGGELVYLREIYRRPPQLLSFMFSICLNFCMGPASLAAEAIIFGKYLLFAIFGSTVTIAINPWTERAAGAFAILLVATTTILSTKWSVRINSVLTILKLGVLIVISISGLVVLCGLTSIPRQTDAWSLHSPETDKTSSGSVQQLASAMFKVLFAYSGWANLNYSLGELKDPERNLPLAVTGGVGITTVLYLLLNLAVYAVVPWTLMAHTAEAVTGEYASIVFGSAFGKRVIPACIALACLGALVTGFFAAARNIQSSAKAGFMPFPRIFGALHQRFETPVNAIVLQTVMSLACIIAVPPGEAFSFLVDVCSYPLWVFCGITAVGLLILRAREPHRTRPFKAVAWLVVLFAISTIFLAVFPFVPPSSTTHKAASIPYFVAPLLGVVFILLGIPLYYAFIW